MSAYLERGRILFFSHSRYADAEREFLRALEHDPDDAEAHALLGLARNRLNRPEEAIESCREAIRLAPEWAYPHYALGYVLEKNDRLEEAATALEEAIRISPHTAYFHSHLAFTRHRLLRYADALASADEGLRCDGQHVDSLNRRAMALAALDRFEEAEQTSRTAVALDPLDGGSLSNLGYILYKRGNATEALDTLTEAMRLDPSMTWAREVTVDTLVLLLEQGDVEEAARRLPEALRRDPDQALHRERLVTAATKPLLRRYLAPITFAWTGACLLTAYQGLTSWVLLGFSLLLLLSLVILPWHALLEPLTYWRLRAHPVVREMLPARLRRHCLLVSAGVLVLAVVAGVYLLFPSPRLFAAVMLIQAMIYPLSGAYRRSASENEAMLNLFRLCIIAAAGLMLAAVAFVGKADLQVFLNLAKGLFFLGVGVTPLLTLLAALGK